MKKIYKLLPAVLLSVGCFESSTLAGPTPPRPAPARNPDSSSLCIDQCEASCSSAPVNHSISVNDSSVSQDGRPQSGQTPSVQNTHSSPITNCDACISSCASAIPPASERRSGLPYHGSNWSHHVPARVVEEPRSRPSAAPVYSSPVFSIAAPVYSSPVFSIDEMRAGVERLSGSHNPSQNAANVPGGGSGSTNPQLG